MALDRGCYHSGDLLGVTYIGGHERCAPVRDSRKLVRFVAAADHHIRAVFEEASRDPAANTARAARDDYSFA